MAFTYGMVSALRRLTFPHAAHTALAVYTVASIGAGGCIAGCIGGCAPGRGGKGRVVSLRIIHLVRPDHVVVGPGLCPIVRQAREQICLAACCSLQAPKADWVTALMTGDQIYSRASMTS